MIEIGSAKAKKGEISKGYLKIGELAMDTPLHIPVVIVRGISDGPTLWINGAVHGDEINGFVAVRNIINKIDTSNLMGNIICTPLSNPLAIQWRNKSNPYDFLDMDQQFPGIINGQYSQRAAFLLFKEIQKWTNYLINFHTVGTYFEAEPYTVYKYSSNMNEKQKQLIQNLALAFGVRLNCKVDLSNTSGEIPGGVAGALDINCSIAGIPAFMAEVGSGGVFENKYIKIAEEGIMNILKYLEMVPEINDNRNEDNEKIIITSRSFLYSDTAGFLNTTCRPGQIINKNNSMGEIFNLFTVLDEIQAKSDSLIIMLRKNPVVHVGDRLAFLGQSWEILQ